MLELLNTNFQSILNTLKEKPHVIIIIALLLSNGFFIRQWVKSEEKCEERMAIVQKEKDELNKVAFDRLIQILDLNTIENRKREAYDSLFREKIIRHIEK